MYKIMEMEEEVRVPADMMGLGLEEAIERAIEKQYEGTINEDLGVVLAVEEVEETGDGRMVPGKGAVYYPAKFRLLT